MALLLALTLFQHLIDGFPTRTSGSLDCARLAPITRILKIAWITLLYVFVFDVIGVIVSFILDVLFSVPLRGASAAAFYALWLVLGVFCGVFAFNRTATLGTGRFVCAASIAFLVLLGAGLVTLFWSSGDDGNYFVPDNPPLTIAFFAGITAGTTAGYKTLSTRPN